MMMMDFPFFFLVAKTTRYLPFITDIEINHSMNVVNAKMSYLLYLFIACKAFKQPTGPPMI